MSLPKAFMDELRTRVPLSDIIGKRMKLVRAGREYKGCCPFHKEKSPSFTVNDIKGFYHCFGCGAHGDAIGFLMNHDNMPFMEAVEQVAGLAGMSVPKPTQEEERRYKQQASLYDLMELAAKWYETRLAAPENRKILQYLTARGLRPETIQQFRVGYAAGDDEELKKQLLRAGFKPDDLIAAGLFKEGTRVKGEVYPFFRARIMFPVQDFQGRVVAFGGRVLPESHGGPPEKSAPKYINSPETDIFHKGRMLYGLSRARKSVGDGEPVLVVEGYMDVIALAQAGFKAAVAPLGTALTEQQIQEIWKVMPEEARTPYLCFDGDAAGQRAAARALERVLPILKPDHSLKFAFLPQEHDPDSLIKAEGVPAMERVLKNAVSLFDMLWQEESRERDLTQPEAKAGLRAALERRARQIADNTVQQFFIHEINQKISDHFLARKQNGKTGQPFQRGVGKGGKGKLPVPGIHSPYRPQSVRVGTLKPARAKQQERARILLAVMIHYPDLYDEFGESLGMIRMEDKEYDQLRQTLINLLGEENSLDYQTLKQHLSELGHGRALDSLFEPSLYLHAGFARPDQSLEEARQAWRDIWEIGFATVGTT